MCLINNISLESMKEKYSDEISTLIKKKIGS